MSAKPDNLASLLNKIGGNNQFKIITLDIEYYPVVIYDTCIAVYILYFIEVCKIILRKLINPKK